MKQGQILIPDIKIWNLHVNQIISRNEKEGQCFGSIEDFLQNYTVCPDCSSDLIRFDMNNSGIFVGGIIFCPYQQDAETHSKGYWVEVWPHEPFIDRASNLDSLAMDERLNISKIREEDHETNLRILFQDSNPLIKRNYRPFNVWNHIRLNAVRKEDGLDYSEARLPEPDYLHL